MGESLKVWSKFTIRVLRAGFVMLSLHAAAQAQQPPKHADSTAPAQSEQTSQNPPQTQENVPVPVEDTLKLLAKRSIFFPDLARDRKPLTSHQKLELATDDSVAPSSILGDMLSAGIDQATNGLKGYGQGWPGYGKRFGSAVATGTMDQYLRTYVLPSALREDPRYFVLLHGTAPHRVLYAITRVLVTETDAREQDTNYSEIFAPLFAESFANIYLPPEQRTVGKTFRRYGIRIGFDAGENVVKEYWPTIFRKLRLSEVASPVEPNPDVVTPASPAAQPH